MIKFEKNKLTQIIQSSSKDIPEILKYFLNRINLNTNTNFSIDWQEISVTEENENAWTFKISDFRGVYGLYYDDEIQNNGWLSGYFRIAYFPHPDEELVGRFSLVAAYQTQQADYFEKINDFIAYPEMFSLFEIGSFSLAVNHDDTALILSLYALSRHKVIKIEGVASDQSEPPSLLIDSNNIDQNLPSFVIAYGLFKMLALIVTFNIQKSPDYLRRDKRRGSHFVYTHDGYQNLEPTNWINEIELHLGYGDTEFEQQVEHYAEGLPEKLESVSWNKGEPYPEFAKNALWWIAHQIDDL